MTTVMFMDFNNQVMFKKEKPIETIFEDKNGLNRGNFAQNLALNIENYFSYTDECLTIGVMGEWGCGKTSLINLTKEYLKNSEIKIMNFNPWIYSSYNQLIEEFFNELILQFFIEDDKTIINDLRAYWFKLNKSNIVKSLIKIPMSNVNSQITNIIDTTMDSYNISVEKLKARINSELKNHKILCIIDDLDRLASDEIKEMFRLIKIMADFNNIIYLVSFDKEIVSDCLNESYGDKFLEKIINVPLDVPMATHDEIKSMLRKNLVNVANVHGLYIDEDRLDSVFDFSIYNKTQNFGISYLFENIRDIKRFTNILEFNIELIKNEVNFVDFTVITAIQVFIPQLYEKIKHNESLLIEYKIPIKEYESMEEFTKKEIDRFEELVGNDENMKFILQRLFPKMYFIYNTEHMSNDSSKYDGELLVCSQNHFKTYFKLNNIVKKITEDEINMIINSINDEESVKTIQYIKNLLITDKLNLFFKSLPQRIDKIKNPEYFLKEIFTFDRKINSNFLDSNRYYIKKTCLWLINKIDSDKRFNILKTEYEESESIYFLYKLINFIELNKYMPYETILSPDEISGLKNIIKEKYLHYASKYFNQQYDGLKNYLEIGQNLQLKNENIEIVKNLLSSKKGLMMFLNFIFNNNENSSAENKINNINLFTDMQTVKEKIDEHYDDLKDREVVIKFLKCYEEYNSAFNLDSN